MRRYLATILIGAVCGLSATNAICQSQSGNRGFGKLTPEWRSFYHEKPQRPFFLIDNQGRRTAEIFVTATHGSGFRQEVRGNTAYDLNMNLTVTVTNLTHDCNVAILWQDFLFREDGQPSPRGLNPPPDAHPESNVPAGGAYAHSYQASSVTTSRAGKFILNEVRPALALQCPLGKSTPPASSSHATTDRTTGRTAGQVGKNIMGLLSGSHNFTIFPPRDTGTDTYEDLKFAGCIMTGHVTRVRSYDPRIFSNDFVFDFSHLKFLVTEAYPSQATKGLDFRYSVVGARFKTGDPFEDQDAKELSFSTDEERQQFIAYAMEAAQACGAHTEVH